MNGLKITSIENQSFLTFTPVGAYLPTNGFFFITSEFYLYLFTSRFSSMHSYEYIIS